MARTASAHNKASLERAQTDLYGILDEMTVRNPEMPDIVTFAEHPEFLNLALPLYPRQRTLLRLIFRETDHMTDYDKDVINYWSQTFYDKEDTIGVPPDIWDRLAWLEEQGYPHFREVMFVGGRRGGKNHIGAIAGNRQMLRLIRMGSPQRVYGIDPNKELVLFATATNFQQARDNQFADILNMAVDAPCFDNYRMQSKNYYLTLQTPGDRVRLDMQSFFGTDLEAEVASITGAAISSNSKAGRGRAVFALYFDEFAHMLTGTFGPRTAEEVYDALEPSLDQMGLDAFIYEPTSPYSKIGKAYEIYQDALLHRDVTDEEAAKFKGSGELVVGTPGHFELVPNPEILVIQLPSWEPYEDWDVPEIAGVIHVGAPNRYDAKAKRLERRDPIKFKVERKAQWAETIDAYFDPNMVETMFEPIEYANGETRTLTEQNQGVLRWAYRGHADPSKSMANFACAIGHSEPIETENGLWPTVIFDKLMVWKPEDFEDHIVDYIGIEEELADTIEAFPTMDVFSYDQYGAFATVALMKNQLRARRSRTRVVEVVFSARENQIRYERFKTALGLGMVKSYRDTFGNDDSSLLENEMKFLQLMRARDGYDKVVTQTIGPVQTKDLLDCVAVVTSELLKDQIDRFMRRENFSMPVAVGAPHGYGTQFEPPPPGVRMPGATGQRTSARDVASQYARGSSGGRVPPWGRHRAGERRLRDE